MWKAHLRLKSVPKELEGAGVGDGERVESSVETAFKSLILLIGSH